MLFGLLYGVLAEVKDRGGEDGGGPAHGDAFNQMIECADPARSDDGDGDGIGDGAGQGEIEALFGAVPVHRREQDFPGTLGGDGSGEVDRVDAGGFAATVGEDFPSAGRDGLGVDGADDALAAELVGGFGNDIGVCDGGGIEADLVRTRQQKGAHICGGADAAAHGQGDVAMLRRASDQIEHRAAVFMSGVDVEKAQFVRARRVIGDGGIHRIARIAQAHEVHALDNAAIGHVEAGDDAGLEHGVLYGDGVTGGKC